MHGKKMRNEMEEKKIENMQIKTSALHLMFTFDHNLPKGFCICKNNTPHIRQNWAEL